MSQRAGPAWLAELQARFGAVLRTPLDRGTGTLRARSSEYDTGALDEVLDAHNATAPERLAVYNRQYWFRLFSVLQTAFPLTVRLLGAWHFNDHAARFLLAHPPHSWDLDRAPDGFEDFLPGSLSEELAERDAWLEAARLDAAWRALFSAPETPPFHPRAEDAARLLDARLVASRSVALFVERWPLIELKRALAGARGEAPVPVPPRLSQPQCWALVRERAGIRQLVLEPREGELFALLRLYTVRDALALLEAGCSPREREGLPAQAQRWLARSVAAGFWSGLTLEG